MKVLKQMVVNLMVVISILQLSVNVIYAQQQNLQEPQQAPNEKKIQKMVSDLSAELSLSTEQESIIALLYMALFEEVRDKMKSGRPSKDEMENLKYELETEVKDILSNDQIVKYEAYLKNASAPN